MWFLKKRGVIFLILSPLRKLTYFIKLVILDEIFIFQKSLMLEYQLVEKNKNIAKKDFFDCVSFRSGLNLIISKIEVPYS